VIYGHEEILKSVNAKYPFTKPEVKHIVIAAGTVNFDQDQLFQNIRPNRVVFGFINALGAGNHLSVTSNMLLKAGMMVRSLVALQFSRITLPDMGTLSTNNPI
jgi:hypothetical protein